MHAFRRLPRVAGAALVSAGLLWAAEAGAAQQIPCGQPYTIEPGDTLRKIAARVGIAPTERMIEWIREANGDVIDSPDLIFAGDVLYIPCEDEAMLAMLEPAAGQPDGYAEQVYTAARENPRVAYEAVYEAAAEAEPAVEGGRASRIFSGPGQFPPSSFGAYAIVAFKSEPLETDEAEFARYRAICEAYVRSIPEASGDVEARLSELVTVWPVKTDDSAERVMETPRDEQCGVAARQYGIDMALEAIRDARRAAPELADDFATRDGPFLLAWNPASKKGEPDALILRMDLSWVRDAGQAKQAFEFWVQRIETNTDLWLDDWERRPLDQIIANTADNWGQAILDSISFIVGKAE